MEPAVANPDTADLESGLILVVDDEENIVTLLSGWLETIGCEVVSAQNGEEGLSQARRYRPDLILMDGMMPRMSGFDACAALKKDPELKDIPVIFLTVNNEMQDVVNGLNLGAHGYMTKPFKPQELLARVRSVLRIKKLQDRLRSRTAQLRTEWAWVKAVMEQLPVGVLVVDPDQQVVFANDMAAALTGQSTQELLGRQTGDLVKGLDPNQGQDLRTEVGAQTLRMIASPVSTDSAQGQVIVLIPEPPSTSNGSG